MKSHQSLNVVFPWQLLNPVAASESPFKAGEFSALLAQPTDQPVDTFHQVHVFLEGAQIVIDLCVKWSTLLACWSLCILEGLFLFFFQVSHHIDHWEAVDVLFSFGVKLVAYLFVGPLYGSFNNGNDFRDIGDVIRLAVRVEEFVLWLNFNLAVLVDLDLELFHFAELNALLVQHIVEYKFELLYVGRVFFLWSLLPLWFMNCAYFQKSFHPLFRLAYMPFHCVFVLLQLPIVDLKCSYTCFLDCHENFNISQLPEVLWDTAGPPLL